MKRWMDYIGYIKYVLIVLLLIFIVTLLRTDKESTVDVETMTKSVLKTMKLDGMTKSDSNMLKRLYGLNENDYEGVTLYTSESTMAVEELLIVKLKSTEQAESVETAVKKRLQSQTDSFEGYGAEQTKLLDNHVLDVEGNYVFYVVHPTAKTAEEAFKQAYKGK